MLPPFSSSFFLCNIFHFLFLLLYIIFNLSYFFPILRSLKFFFYIIYYGTQFFFWFFEAEREGIYGLQFTVYYIVFQSELFSMHTNIRFT